MFIGAATIVFGTCLQATALGLGQFMGGRFILGFGCAIIASAGPSYVSEMAHPTYRGIMTGIYNTCWYVGATPGTFIPYATSTMAGTQAWRIPVWIQLVFSGIVLLASPFLPETPRWLVANDRHQEALRVMVGGNFPGSRISN
jgi:MFS family permease